MEVIKMVYDQKEYNREHREEKLEKGRKYYEEHREENIEYSRKKHEDRRARHLCLDCGVPALPGVQYCENHSRKRAMRAINLRRSRRDQVFTLLGGRCAWCSLDDWRVLQVDHIVGDGAAERRQFGGKLANWASDGAYTKYMVEHLEKYQLLCANCHALKTQGERQSRCKWCEKEEIA